MRHHKVDEHLSVCVLTSGGLDSCVLVHEMTGRFQEVFPVYVRAGLHWEEAEVSSLRKFLKGTHSPRIKDLTELTLRVDDVYQEHWSTTGVEVPDGDTPDEAVYLPGRNILLLSKGAVFCALNGIHTIALAVLNTNPFPDATPQFFHSMQEAVSLGLFHPIEILRPFSHLQKKQVMELGRPLPLELTFSCIDPHGGHHCGKCNKCAERKAAFASIGMEDRTVYDKVTG